MPDFEAGDVCRYSFGKKNKSDSTVDIVRILDDPRGVAEVKFLAVRVDDSGNGYFSHLLKTGGAMNVSLKYLRKEDA